MGKKENEKDYEPSFPLCAQFQLCQRGWFGGGLWCLLVAAFSIHRECAAPRGVCGTSKQCPTPARRIANFKRTVVWPNAALRLSSVQLYKLATRSSKLEYARRNVWRAHQQHVNSRT